MWQLILQRFMVLKHQWGLRLMKLLLCMIIRQGSRNDDSHLKLLAFLYIQSVELSHALFFFATICGDMPHNS